MNITLKLEGFPEEIINAMIANKLAMSKTEAVRLAILDFNEHHRLKKLEQYIEDGMAVKRMQEMEEEITSGKKKTLSKEDVLKKYPHLRDV